MEQVKLQDSEEKPEEKLIVFDFDATLVDSRKLIVESHRIVFTEFRLPLPSQDKSLALIGKSLELVLAELAGNGAPIADMVGAYGRLLPRLRADPAFAETPFDGIAELLAELNSTDAAILGIATGHTSTAILPALDTLGWRPYFHTIHTADMAPSKPHPAMLLQALEARGAKAEDGIFIGDTTFDMEMARAAGFHAIGVDWGFHGSERLLSAGANRVAHDVAELWKHIQDGRTTDRERNR
jgi:phosphoglycolate phosphatase